MRRLSSGTVASWMRAAGAVCGAASLAAIACAALPANAQYFYANGLHKGLADPAVIYQVIGDDGGYYYGTGTGAYQPTANAKSNGPTGTYTIYRSKSLAGLFASTDTIAVPVTATSEKPGETASADSPGLFYFRNHLYLSYHSNKQTQVAHSVGSDPEGSWIDDPHADLPGRAWQLFRRMGSRGQLLNELYGFYTGQSDTHVVKMTDPAHRDASCDCDTVISKSVYKDSPEAAKFYRPWAHRANIHPPGVNEGPSPFTTTDKAGVTTTWLTYSANSYRSDAYAVGLLKFIGSDSDKLTRSDLWQNETEPFFEGPGQGTGDNVIYSTGANNMFRDRTGKPWNIYGARFHSAYTNERELRLDPVAFDADGKLMLRQPGPSAEGQLVPAPRCDDPPVSPQFFTLSANERTQSFGYQDPRVYYSDVSSTPTTKDDPYQADQHAPWTDLNPSTPYKRTYAPYAYYMIEFVGRSIAVHAPTGQGFGTASIFKDGVSAGVVDFGRPASGPALVTNYGTEGQHTLLVMIQAKDPSSPTPLAKDQLNHQVGLASFTISRDPQP